MAGVDEARDELVHLRDVAGRARFVARRHDVEGIVGGGEGPFIEEGVGEPRPALLDGLREDLVVDVGDVADERDTVAAVEQPAAEHVEDRRRTQVPDVRFALHGRPTDVDPHVAVDDGPQFGGPAGGGVVQSDSHPPKSTGHPRRGGPGQTPDSAEVVPPSPAVVSWVVTPASEGHRPCLDDGVRIGAEL